MPQGLAKARIPVAKSHGINVNQDCNNLTRRIHLFQNIVIEMTS